MVSKRLRYDRVSPASVDKFHTLVQDAHVRRFLMDGQVFPRTWSEERIRDSDGLFERRGVGLWLAYEREVGALVGFCGFLEIPSIHHEPQLVYALFERYTGLGYATEMGRAAIAEARRRAGFDRIAASVDDVNSASVRVLEKLGFRQIATHPGSFGNVLVWELDAANSDPGRPARGQ
jgi:RimJ/RimL family protein N-acetyltransferase